jgi:hypothetical protein
VSSFGNQPQWGPPREQPQGQPAFEQQAYGQQAYGQQHGEQPRWALPPDEPYAPYQPQQHGQPNGQGYGQQAYGQGFGQQAYGRQDPGQPYQPPFGLSSAADDARRRARSSGVRQMAIGGVIALIGIALTVATYAAASDGGHYVVAYGPAIVGVITFVRGLVGYLKA